MPALALEGITLERLRNSSIGDHKDVDLTALTPNDVLAWNGTNWVPASSAPPASHNLTFHSDVIVTSPATGQVLGFDGVNWVNRVATIITSVGVLNAGSITSGFGNINIGTSTIASGDITVDGIVAIAEQTSGVSSVLVIDQAAGATAGLIQYKRQGVMRWQNGALGNSDVNEFGFGRHNDAGVFQNHVMLLNRQTGTVTFEKDILALAVGSDIGTATIPFNKIFISDAAFADVGDAFLNVFRSAGGGSGSTTQAGYATIDVTAAATGVHMGFESRVAISATTGTVINAWAQELFNVVTGAAAITNLRGLLIQSHLQTGSGTTTLYTGIRIQDPIVSAGNIITAIGIDIDNISTGDTNFSIRTGTGTVELGGGLRLPLLAAGQHAIGTSLGRASTQLALRGILSQVSNAALRIDTTLDPGLNGPASITLLEGTIKEHTSGAHPDFDQLTLFAPGITLGGATTTRATTLRIVGAPTAGATNRAFWVQAGLSEVQALTAASGSFTTPLPTASTVAKVASVVGGTGVDSTGGENPSLSFDASELAVGGTLVATDHLVAANAAVSNRQLISSIPLGIFNNDQGWTSNTGDITGVNITAGNGLTGDVNTASGDHVQTINAVGTTNRISVSADAIDIDSAYVGQASITTVGTIATGVWNAGAVTSSGTVEADQILATETATGQAGLFRVTRAGVLRWQAGWANSPDSWVIFRYNDAGSILGTAFAIDRNTGDATFESKIFPTTAGVSDFGTATLPFGKTYIGNAAFTASDGFLNVIRTDGTGSTTTLLAGYSYLDITAAATGAHIGFEARAIVSATTGTINNAWSMECFQVVTGAATISNLRGLLIQSHLQAGSGTTTIYQGIRIQNPIVSAGSIGTAIAIDIEDITTAGTNFSIRTGLGDVSFGGPLVAGSITSGFGTINIGTSTITSGAITSSGTITVDPSSGNAILILDQASGTSAGQIRYTRAGVNRWTADANDNSDVNDYVLNRFNDAGVFQGAAFVLRRASGNAEFEADVSMVTFTISSTALVTNLNADRLDSQHGSFYRNAGNLNAGTLINARVSVGNVTQHEGSINHDALSNFLTGEHFIQSAITTTGVLNSGSISIGFGNINVGNSNIEGGTLIISHSTGNSNIVSNQAAANVASFFRIERTGTLRWQAGASGNTDTNDFDFFRYNDSGTFQGNVMSLSRANGTATFNDSGVIVGAPTGGDKGGGTINVATDIFKNNTAYTNPDAVLEKYWTGKVIKYVDSPFADYPGLMPLAELREYTKEHWHLPRIHRGPMGVFDMTDILLEKVEELTLYACELNEKITDLELRLAA